MRKTDVIREQLEAALTPLQLKVLDESAHHAGHAGSSPVGETHFAIDIVSRRFENLSRVERHRLVYQALSGLFENGLHAVQIKTRAPGE